METRFNNFLSNFIKINHYLIKNVQYNILISSCQEPYIVTEFLEKINIYMRNECELIDEKYEPFAYNVFDNNNKVYKNDLDKVIEKISFELMYLITHKDFNLDNCEIKNNNEYLNDTLIKLQTFFYKNKLN
jgi:hypothetical protein